MMKKIRYKPTYGDGLTVAQRFYRRHRERRNAERTIYMKNWLKTEKGKASSRKGCKSYYQAHKEYWVEFNKKRDKVKHRQCMKRYYEKNKGRFIVNANNCKTLTKDLTFQIFQLVYEDNIKKYGTLTCYLCLKPIEFGNDHLEHKTPLCRGGTSFYNNLEVSCNKCNRKKGRKTEEEFRQLLKV